MNAPIPEHTTCAQQLIDVAAEVGTEVTVSELPPLVIGPYTADPFICPHKVTFWVEPTGEQIAQWVKAGTP
jgi:hypothetical protein